ncbi:MAG: hypothetical protein JSW61_05245 [Candidatus Thorarchaeota archaeon]|nr:MAG: hypothetical protein JSW61_05245 [Candidatus Thorarchaeota archaeon]
MDNDRLLSKDMTRDRLGDVIASSDLFDREFGAQLASWELRYQRQFIDRAGGRSYRLRGFARQTRNRSIVLLTPSPWMHGGVFLYLTEGINHPPDGARVEVLANSISLSEIGLQRAFLVESIEMLPVDVLSEIDPPLGLRQLSSLLFEHVGMAEASKRVFARLFVSSPPYEGHIGGMTAGIQAIASRPQVQRLLSFMRNILPPALRRRSRTTRIVGGIPVLSNRSWRFEIGQLSKADMFKPCVERIDSAGFSEVSIAALTTTTTATLPDVPLALAAEDFWVESSNAQELRLPIIKAVITSHMLNPAVASRSVDSATKHVISRIDILRESFGFDEIVLGRGGLLDADSLGRPLSTLRIARSSARAGWRDKVTSKDLQASWNRVLEPALKEFIELSQFKADSIQKYGNSARLHEFNSKVWRALERLDTGKRGSLGPTLDEIAREANVQTHEAAKTLSDMKSAGVVYEPRPGRYRMVL